MLLTTLLKSVSHVEVEEPALRAACPHAGPAPGGGRGLRCQLPLPRPQLCLGGASLVRPGLHVCRDPSLRVSLPSVRPGIVRILNHRQPLASGA